MAGGGGGDPFDPALWVHDDGNSLGVLGLIESILATFVLYLIYVTNICHNIAFCLTIFQVISPQLLTFIMIYRLNNINEHDMCST